MNEHITDSSEQAAQEIVDALSKIDALDEILVWTDDVFAFVSWNERQRAWMLERQNGSAAQVISTDRKNLRTLAAILVEMGWEVVEEIPASETATPERFSMSSPQNNHKQ